MVNDELYHWGIKGQRWGIRRFQNADGSLTPLGQKRYNAEVERVKKETAKVKAAEKVKANREKTQAKFDKLEAKKADLAKRKKALKGKDEDAEEAKKKAEENESIEERREKLLKSTDAKELYENRSLLTTNELNERLNRLDTEARLQNKLPKEEEKTLLTRMDDAKQYIDKATNLYKSVDGAYSAVLNSAIGKQLAKTLGLETPKESWINEMTRKYKAGKLDDKEMQAFNNYLNTEKQVKKKFADQKAEKEAAKKEAVKKAKQAEEEAAKKAKQAEEEAAKKAKQAEKETKEAKESDKKARKQAGAQKQVDDYNERWQRGDSDDKVTSEYATNAGRGRRETSRTIGIEQKATRLSDDDVEVIPPDNDWADRYARYQASQSAQSNARNFTSSSGNTSVSNVSSSTSSHGQEFITIAGNVIPLPEDKSGR